MASDACSQVYLHTKYQLPGIDGGFKTVTLDYSNFFPNLNSGFNLFIQNDNQPQNILNFSRISGSYVYRLKIAKIHIGFWVQARGEALFFNPGNVVLPSMIDPSNGQIIGTPAINSSQSYWRAVFDFGYLLYSKRFFIGNGLNGYAQTGNAWLADKSVTTVVGYNFQGRDFDVETYAFLKDLSYIHGGLFVNYEKLWLGGGIDIEKFFLKKIYIDLGIKHNRARFSFNYGIVLNKNLFSTYEFGINFRFKCKKSGRTTIICPAYQL